MHEQHHPPREHRHHGHAEHPHMHHHHHALHIRIIPHVRRIFHEMRHMPMSAAHLDHMTTRVMDESGMLHDMPHGHTRESMGDFVRFLLLALVDGTLVDGMSDGQHEPAAEAFHPLVPFPWGFGFPFTPYPFFFPGRRPHFRPGHPGRPGGRPGGHRR